MPASRSAALLALALCFTAWTVIGLRRGLHTGFSGGLYDPEYRVPGVMPGSAAARAGFLPGDRILAVQGIPIERLGMESRWPRSLSPAIGATYRFTVERGARTLDVHYTYPPPSPAAVANRVASAILSLGFLVFGLWAALTSTTRAAAALLPVALCAGLSSAATFGPSLGLPRGPIDHLSTAASVLLCLLLFRFFLIYPDPKPIAGSRLLWYTLSALWAGLLCFLAAELFTHPTLYYSTGSVAGPLMLLYLLLTLAAILHTLWKTPRSTLRRSGFHSILAAILIAAGAAFSSFFPGWTSALPALLVPFTMARAARTAPITPSP